MPIRHLCSELVSVLCSNFNQWPSIISANLEEIGEWSAVLLADSPIRCGTTVQVSCEASQLKGVVESCDFEGPLGFFVGVRLDPESRWSQKWFAPKHLLTLPVDQRQSEIFPLGAASGY